VENLIPEGGDLLKYLLGRYKAGASPPGGQGSLYFKKNSKKFEEIEDNV